MVTGARGFIGQHLRKHLDDAGAEVIGASNDGVADVTFDLRDPASIRDALKSVCPSVVINLAAIADPRQADDDPVLAYDVNVLGQLRLILAMRELVPRARLVVVGSALQYGRDGAGGLIGEDDPLRPDGVYAVTKTAADLQAWQHYQTDGLDIVRVRLFNVVGPGRPDSYFPAPQIRQVVEISEFGAPPIINTLGLQDSLDFIDVRDAASAIEAVAIRGVPGEAYNVASGKATPLRTVIDRLMAVSGVEAEVAEPPIEVGRSGRVVIGNVSKIARDTGWRPVRSLDDSLRDALEDVRRRMVAVSPAGA